MFGIFAKLLCSIASFLFPVFASYKALKANDPSQLTPWLMYWVVMACIIVIESWTGWFLVWLPFYQEIRAGFMLWLVLPQFQGATRLYIEYVHPALEDHEKEIENFISRTHDQLKAAGIQYIRKIIRSLQEAVFGPLQGSRGSGPRPGSPVYSDAANYAQTLFARWKVSPLSPYAPQMATDFYQFVSSALQQDSPENPERGATGGGGGGGGGGAPGMFPEGMNGAAEKTKFMELQRERLKTAMAALDSEMASLRGPNDASTVASSSADSDETLSKSFSSKSLSKSLSEFDHVSMTEAAGDFPHGNPEGKTWWGWGGKPQPEGGEVKSEA